MGIADEIRTKRQHLARRENKIRHSYMLLIHYEDEKKLALEECHLNFYRLEGDSYWFEDIKLVRSVDVKPGDSGFIEIIG